MRQHLKCGDKNCRVINAVSAKRCFYCQNKLKDKCLPRTASVIKAKLRRMANGGDKDNNGIGFHSVLCMVRYEVEDKNTYIFTTDGIPSENDVKKCMISQKKCRCVSMMKMVKKEGKHWDKVTSTGTECATMGRKRQSFLKEATEMKTRTKNVKQ